jgi:hypothetical protein
MRCGHAHWPGGYRIVRLRRSAYRPLRAHMLGAGTPSLGTIRAEVEGHALPNGEAIERQGALRAITKQIAQPATKRLPRSFRAAAIEDEASATVFRDNGAKTVAIFAIGPDRRDRTVRHGKSFCGACDRYDDRACLARCDSRRRRYSARCAAVTGTRVGSAAMTGSARTIMMGQGAWSSTPSAVLPSTRRSTPPRPWLARTASPVGRAAR